MASLLIKKGEYWYLKNNKGRDKLLPNEFQNSPILSNAYTMEAGIFPICTEFSKFSANINSPLQFIRYIETILYFELDFNKDPHILDAAIIYINKERAVINSAVIDGPSIDGPSIDGPIIDGPIIDGPVIDGAIIDGPVIDGPIIDDGTIEIIVKLLSENIAHIKEPNKFFLFIDHIYNSKMGRHYTSDINKHILHLCAKYDFKEYFVFIYAGVPNLEPLDVEKRSHLSDNDDNTNQLLLFILIINNSNRIFYYLLSNLEQNIVQIPPEFYDGGHYSMPIMQLFCSAQFYNRKIYNYFDILEQDKWSQDSLNILKYINAEQISYNDRGELILDLNEDMAIQLLQLYRFELSDYYTSDYIIVTLFHNLLTMSIKGNYHSIFTYLIRICADLIFPIEITSHIKIDIFNILKEDNIQFMLDLYHSKLNRHVAGFSHNLFTSQIKSALRHSELNNSIVSIDMMQLLIDLFEYCGDIINLDLCGNIETVLYYFNKDGSYLSIKLINKMLKYNCTVSQLKLVMDAHIMGRSTLNWGDIIPTFMIPYIIICGRDDLYDYIVSLHIQYNEGIRLFTDISMTLFVSVDVDYFISKLQHILLINKMHISHWNIRKIIELCFLDLKFIKVIDMIYDYILKYKPYLFKKKNNCHCYNLCNDCILCNHCARIEDFYTNYILNDITRDSNLDKMCDLYDISIDYYIYRAIIISNAFYQNYKKFNIFYKNIHQLYKMRNVTIISRTERKLMQDYLLNNIKSKELKKLQHHIKNTYLIIVLQLCKKTDIYINNSVVNIILEYIDFNSLKHLLYSKITLGIY